MANKITAIEGIGPAMAKKLAEAGITTVEGLLKAGASKDGRKELSATTGVDMKKILVFVNMADLFRVKGVGSQYAELLKASGVDTVVELAGRKPANLHAKMEDINAEKKLVRQAPRLKSVEDWVAFAKELPRVVTH